MMDARPTKYEGEAKTWDCIKDNLWDEVICYYNRQVNNREFDLAMTTIFGGFDQSFYDAYNRIYPLDTGFEDRLPWYQFYYLGFHLILFGETYGGSVDRILNKF